MKPLQLVRTGESGTDFEVVGSTLRVLESESRPVTVVSIVGPYRTGKSYLQNQLMRGGGEGGSDSAEVVTFSVGSKVEAHTRRGFQ